MVRVWARPQNLFVCFFVRFGCFFSQGNKNSSSSRAAGKGGGQSIRQRNSAKKSSGLLSATRTDVRRFDRWGFGFCRRGSMGKSKNGVKINRFFNPTDEC